MYKLIEITEQSLNDSMQSIGAGMNLRNVVCYIYPQYFTYIYVDDREFFFSKSYIKIVTINIQTG